MLYCLVEVFWPVPVTGCCKTKSCNARLFILYLKELFLLDCRPSVVFVRYLVAAVLAAVALENIWPGFAPVLILIEI